jgi:hypothetical protein
VLVILVFGVLMNSHPLAVEFLPDGYAISRLPANEPIPAWAAGPFVSITRTADELSIVCRQAQVPADVKCERDWRCLRIVGAIPFSMVGVLASLLNPLADANIAVFTISTFDTDYVFVKEKDAEKARHALQLTHSCL